MTRDIRIAKSSSILPLLGLFMLLASCDKLRLRRDEPEPQGLVRGDTLAYFDFEKEVGEWPEKEACCTWSALLDRSVKRFGERSLRFEIRKTDTLGIPNPPGNAPSVGLGLKSDDKINENWYAFSTLFPDDFIADQREDIVVQWQARPDFHKGEDWRSPPLLIGVLRDSLVLEIRSDEKEVTTATSYTFNRINLGKLEKGKWNDWVFHVNWAYDNSGKIEIWKDKVLVLSRLNQANCYNDEYSPYLRIGLYRTGNAPGNTGQRIMDVDHLRTVYFDHIVVGNQNLTFDTVSPK